MEQIEGVLEDIIFYNEQNGYMVFSLKHGRESTTCVGTMPALVTGERLRVSGEWTEHRDYGRQLKVAAFESVRPTTRQGIEKYLGSGIIRGMGPATAKLVVHEFGSETLEVLDDHPERLTEVPGIGPKRAAMIAQSYQQQRSNRQAMIFLQSYGLTPALANRVLKVFGEHAQEVIRSDPYRLVEQVEGIGFKTADAIAFSLGIERESEHRLICGIQYVLSEAVHGSGHLFLPREILMDSACELLQAGRPLCERALDILILNGQVILREIDGCPVIYDRCLYEAERDVALRLCRMMESGAGKTDKALDDKIRSYEKAASIQFGDQQRLAVRTALTGKISIITGGPGTGKTTCIRCMLDILRASGTVLLCAPTGRAAKRMQEASGEPAQTIHRLLEFSGEDGGFARNEDNPLDVDTLIVDEVSMVDLMLMRSLLRALPAHTRLILVGDADQLPSVGAGNVLSDLIASEALPVVRLTEIYRQAAMSDIVLGAHAINRGEMPRLNRRDGDFFFQRADTPRQAAEIVRALVCTRLPAFMQIDPVRDIQAMSPMKKGDAGVWAMNRMLQEALNPPSPDRRELHAGDALMREGDKVMQIRNNYDLEWTRGDEEGTGVFNGDIGYITEIDPEEGSVCVTFDDERSVVYRDEALEDLEIAYCMSVHKSQGSEFDVVVMPLVSGPPMLLTRNLLYTAVTRAKRMAVLVGRSDCIRQMVDNCHISRRYSNLANVLREIASK